MVVFVLCTYCKEDLTLTYSGEDTQELVLCFLKTLMFYFFLLNTSVVVFCTLFFRFSLCFLFSTFFFTLFSQNSYALVISSQHLGCNFFILCFFFFLVFLYVFYFPYSFLLYFLKAPMLYFFLLNTLAVVFIYSVFRFFSLFFIFSHSFSFLPPNCDSFLQPHPTRERGRENER